jgi:hypothetical protein
MDGEEKKAIENAGNFVVILGICRSGEKHKC